jgi:hypothetical protein
MPVDHQVIARLDLNWEYLRWNALRSTKRKLFYVATPKVACTSLKWWFARLEGYGGALQANSEESKETSPELIIHDSLYKVAPDVAGLAPECLVEAIVSDDYFRFALVRNPFKRIFSAWQSKLLLREPLQIAPYIEKAFYHRTISSKAAVAEAFELFLEHLAKEEAPTYWDVHWTPQVNLLRPDIIHYTNLSQIENACELERLLAGWLGDQIASPFANRMANESLVPYQEEFISDRSAQLVRTLYSADFELFGYDTRPPREKESFSSDEFNLALKAIEMIRARHERIRVARIATDRKMHDLQTENASKDENLTALRREFVDAIVQHSKELSRSETNRLQLESDKTALEADIARLQSACTEKDLDRTMLRNELVRAAISVNRFRENIAQPRSTVGTSPAKELNPTDLWQELDGLKSQIDLLKKLQEQVNTLNREALQFNSLRFLVGKFISVLSNRMIGRHT